MTELARDAAFAAVSTAFGSIGRVCMALDGRFCVRHVSSQLDLLLGPGAAKRVIGEPIEKLLGPELFADGSALRLALAAGEKREGWRALLHGESGATRLLSITAAPLQSDPYGVCDPSAVYLLVLRPAEDDPACAGSREPLAGPGLICRSQAMGRVFRLVETLQHSESSILITGESGTGKEVMARTIHAHSPRQHGPFVAVNAAALPGDLLESELFGHVRGAFTGAVRDRPGRFELATDGTLFLDEVGDVPLHLQVKLLRVLQERTYERVGDGTTRQTNARIIAATNRDLRRAVAAGAFREDLYYRLKVFPIELPPLRARREDIEPIASYLLARVGARTGRALRFSPEALRALMSHDWPGNVRELENALEFGATVCRGQTLQPEDLPPEVVSPAPRVPAPAPAAAPAPTPTPVPWRSDAGVGLPDDRILLQHALEAHRWNRLETARALGVSRSTLWRRMRTAGLE
ncbi:sigma-54-dependent Fis family transcriptional regulator [Anaeromyxobacter diazotrophicus]|uniref:Sigma-54-dependent Fis family transcriptional regulator n=2 Tax=Anaeromyxobacter diazotrophicus TaxID=2590199 RepID=A0A7I9VIR3_9BACT|nr:sigma-54-dependent Fis family transcriptional regulator [Anaeromyxobacter diazotrophicus]